MIADQPFVSYKKNKEVKHKQKEMEGVADRWAELHKNRKSRVGKNVKLGDFFADKSVENAIKKD